MGAGLSLSSIPDSTVKHSDWEVSVVARLTAADGVAVGGGLFSFRNGSYGTDPVWSGLTYDFAFAGGGFGAGGGVRKLFQIRPSGLRKSWHKIKCDRAFSATDLSGSSGRMTSFTLGVYEIVLISAGNLSGSMFGGQSVSGFGLGLGGAVLVGAWAYAF